MESQSIRRPSECNCRTKISEGVLEEVGEFQYLATMLCRNGNMDSEVRNRLATMLCRNGTMDSEVRNRTVQGRKTIGELGNVMKDKRMRM